MIYVEQATFLMPVFLFSQLFKKGNNNLLDFFCPELTSSMIAPSNIYSCTSIQHNLTYLTFLQSRFMRFTPFLQRIALSFVNLMKFKQKRVEIVSHHTISTLTNTIAIFLTTF